MNARLIKVVIILMSVALAGSVFVQVYWSYELTLSNKLDFDNRVNKAMHESAFRYKSFVFNANKDVIKYKNDFAKYVDSLRTTSNLYSIASIPFIIDDDLGNSSLKSRYSTQSNLRSHGAMYKRYEAYEAVGDNDFFIMDSIGLKTRMLKDLSDLLISTFVQKRAVIDSVVLDSIIDVSLRMNGIDIPYEFGVYNTYLDKFIVKSNDKQSVLKKSYYEIVLYNLSTEDKEQILLKIQFPNSRFYIIQRILFMLGLQIVFTIVIILAFYITVSMIYSQKKMSEIKNELIGNISHELKTPISIISLALQSMQDPDVSKRTLDNRYLKMIEDENKRFSLLVENILLSSILDSGNVPINIKNVDVHDVLDKIVKGMQLKADTANIKIEIEKNADAAIIDGDEMMITNLYSSIIENAIKYSAKRDGEESFVKIRTSSLKGKFFKVEIEDNGIGILKEDQKHIFEKLFRVPSKNIHNVKGHGLGLSYAKSIAKLHNGDITLKSQLGVGSTFNIILPFQYIESE